MENILKLELTLSAVQYPLGDFSLFLDKWEKYPNDKIAELKSNESNMVKDICPCTYSYHNGLAIIEYTERNPLKDIKNTIIYNSETNTATIKKSGGVSAEIVVSEGEKAVHPYITVMGNFELAAKGISLTSKLVETGGVLHLDYISELRGLDAQRIIMRISVKKYREERSV